MESIKNLSDILRGKEFKRVKGLKLDAPARKLLTKPYMTQKDLYDAASILSSNGLHLQDRFKRRDLKQIERENANVLTQFRGAYNKLMSEIRATTENIIDDLIRHLQAPVQITTGPKLAKAADQLQELHRVLALADAETTSAFINYLLEVEKVRTVIARSSVLKTSSDPNLKKIADLAEVVKNFDGKKGDIENLFNEIHDFGEKISDMKEAIGSSAAAKAASQDAYFEAMKEFADVCSDTVKAARLLNDLLPSGSRAVVASIEGRLLVLSDTLLVRINDLKNQIGEPTIPPNPVALPVTPAIAQAEADFVYIESQL